MKYNNAISTQVNDLLPTHTLLAFPCSSLLSARTILTCFLQESVELILQNIFNFSYNLSTVYNDLWFAFLFSSILMPRLSFSVFY